MRPANWPEILAAEIAAADGVPFAWGRHDCFTWAARVVRKLGGPELAAMAGAWGDEAGALRAVMARGRDLEEAVAALCAQAGLQAVPVAFAQRGDLVVLRSPRGPLCGVCNGRVAMGVAETAGLLPLPMALALRAWAI